MLIAENPMLENGGCSLVCEPSKYKRRRVSAARDFPPGCGPNAPRVDLTEDEAVCHSENVEDTEHPVCDVERKKENCDHGAGHSSNVESEKTSCDAEHRASGGVEHADDGLVDLSKNLGSDHILGETVIRACSLSEPLQVHTDCVNKESLHEAQEPLKDLMEVELEVPPGALNGAEGSIKETIDIFVTEEKLKVNRPHTIQFLPPFSGKRGSTLLEEEFLL